MKSVNPRPCGHCGEVYQPRDHNPSRKFCSRECVNLSRRKGQQLACADCGALFYRKAAQIRKGAKYCSRACRDKNFFWQTDEQYRINAGKYINQARRSKFNLALKGETCCRNCGSRERLNLHHIIPRSMFMAGREEIRNGLPLCSTCHSSWHARGRVTIYRDIFTQEEWAYLSSVTLLGQNVGAWLDDRYPVREPQDLAA